MDLDETQIREEIRFWTEFIEAWKGMRGEPAYTMALESLACAEKKLQSCLTPKAGLDAGGDTEGKRDCGSRA